MSDIITAAVAELRAKIGDSFDGSAKFLIEGEGAIVINGSGVHESDDDTDVTLMADVDTFRGILAGDINPTSAFMSGKLSVDGDMGTAMKLGALLG